MESECGKVLGRCQVSVGEDEEGVRGVGKCERLWGGVS